MLQDAYFLAKIGADTAENEHHFAEILPKQILQKLLNLPARPPAGDALAGALGLLAAGAACTAAFNLALCAPARNWDDSDGAKLANLNLQIFGGLVLRCIKTKFCKKICV